MTKIDDPALIREYIEAMLPWAHGHQIKGLTDYVIAILDCQTGIIALLLLVSLGTALLALGKRAIIQLLRRVASRRRDRWEVSLVHAILMLIKIDSTLWPRLRQDTTLDLAALPNVS